VLNEYNTVFARSGPLYATGVSLSVPVVDANGISIASAVFAGLTRWQTDWQTDRPRYSVGNNRQMARSAQWISQILFKYLGLLESRLDRSNQLQQSAAIFSCNTRRVAVYLETHYNMVSKWAFPTGVPDKWHNCLLIYWRKSCLVPAFDDTWCHLPASATEWCQRYLPCSLLSVFNSVCFSAHWPSFALFIGWPGRDLTT